MPQSRTVVGWFSAVILLLPCVGCSFDDVPLGVSVSGYVTFDGQPIHDGLITFYPPLDREGRGASGRIKNGHYSIPRHEGPYPGKSEIQIVELERSLGKGDVADNNLVISTRIPKIYNFFTTLRVEVPDRHSMVYLLDLPAEHKLPKH